VRAAQDCDDALREEATLKILNQLDLSSAAVEKIARDHTLRKNRKIALALLAYPKLPRRLATPLLRGLYSFDLMKVALGSAKFTAEIQKTADEILISRLESITSGEKLTLARRASARVTAELLNATDPKIVGAALANPRLTEAAILKALNHDPTSQNLVQAIRRHAKWSLRKEIRAAIEAKEQASPAPT
jgi:hypothetical protein